MRKNNSGATDWLLYLLLGILGTAAITFLLVAFRPRRERGRLERSTEPTALPQDIFSEDQLDLSMGFDLESSLGIDDRFDPIIPHNALSKSSRYMRVDAKYFNITRLRRSHVNSILEGLYSAESKPSGLLKTVPIESVLGETHENVCAITRGRGVPIATGVLIAPDLLLTARHTLENLPIHEIRIRQNYELTRNGMNYGSCISITGIVEQNPELDYVIVQLSEPVNHFKPIDLCLSENHVGESMLIHHAGGNPKQVSIHATLESDYHQFSYSGFHDSYKGSSGGVYINPESKLFGLHLLRSGITTAVWIKNIWGNSTCMQDLYDENGRYLDQPISCMEVSNEMLEPSELSDAYRKALERVDRPNNLDNINDAYGQIRMSYHHIIPIGDMEFLWVMGREFPPLGELLTELAFEKSDIINNIAWAPWNLMVGPTNRTDDAHASDQREKTKPNGFPIKLWNALEQLHDSIVTTWNARFLLSQEQNFSRYQGAQITEFDRLDGGASTAGNINNITFHRTRALKKRPYKLYGKCILEVMKKVRAVREAIPVERFDEAYPYIEGEWQDARHDRYAVMQ